MGYSFSLLRIGDTGISGNLYTSGKERSTVVVWGVGAPRPPDYGNLAEAESILGYETDLFVPDYLGYARSDGRFTPMNCIRTFLRIYDSFTSGCIGRSGYSGERVKIRYGRLIFAGKSLGGSYVPLLPRFNKRISELGLFAPALDNKSSGSIAGEETNADFFDSMRYDGYHHIYRGILSKRWEEHLENKDGLSPMDNIAHLGEARIFLAHGRSDRCIHFSKSVSFYESLQRVFPDSTKRARLFLYPGDHCPSTTIPAIKDFMKWFGIKKRS